MAGLFKVLNRNSLHENEKNCSFVANRYFRITDTCAILMIKTAYNKPVLRIMVNWDWHEITSTELSIAIQVMPMAL